MLGGGRYANKFYGLEKMLGGYAKILYGLEEMLGLKMFGGMPTNFVYGFKKKIGGGGGWLCPNILLT